MNSLKLILILVLFASCNTKKESSKTEINGKKVFGNFMIALGENFDNKVQCVASFSENDEDGDQFGLGNSTSVLLDSFRLVFDSVIYPQYDTELDTIHFLGKHSWNITKNSKTKHYSFESKPFKILSILPDVVGKEDVIVKCNSLQNTDKVTLLISGDYTENSETIIDITPSDGYFTITKSILDKIEGSNLLMHFNISSVKKIDPDDFLTAGGLIEATRVTKQHEFKIVR